MSMSKTIEVTTFWEYYPDDDTFPQLLGGWDEILIEENEEGFEKEKKKRSISRTFFDV